MCGWQQQHEVCKKAFLRLRSPLGWELRFLLTVPRAVVWRPVLAHRQAELLPAAASFANAGAGWHVAAGGVAAADPADMGESLPRCLALLAPVQHSIRP